MPSFYTPNRRVYYDPDGFEINWANPLTRGLILCIFPGARSRTNFATGQIGFIFGSANFNAGLAQTGTPAFESTTQTTDGLYFPFHRSQHLITTDHSFYCGISWDTYTSYNNIISIPANSTWSNPYASMAFQRYVAGTQAQYFYSRTSSSYRTCQSGTGFLDYSGYHRCGFTRDGADVSFYRDGVYHSNGAALSPSADPWQGNEYGITILNRSYLDPGEGTDGKLSFALFWTRVLSADEFAEIDRYPFGVLKSKIRKTIILIPAGAPISATAGIASAAATAYGVTGAPTGTVTVAAGIASAAATAYTPTGSFDTLTVAVDIAPATATAYTATGTAIGTVTVAAGIASSDATAYAPTVYIRPIQSILFKARGKFRKTQKQRGVFRKTQYAKGIF